MIEHYSKIVCGLATLALFLIPTDQARGATSADSADSSPVTIDNFRPGPDADVEGARDRKGDEEDEEEEAEEDADRGRKTKAKRSSGPRRRIIKVVQRRNFLKLRRLEATVPSIGMVTNDPFLRRILFSGKFEFHFTEISSIGAYLCFSPNLGDSDRKSLTNQLEQRNEVVPDLSRIIFVGIIDYGVSPIFGKVELGTTSIINYDIYICAGAGVLYSKDDEELVQGGDEEYRDQLHPVTSFGFGFRIAFNEWFGVRLEARSLTHIEQVSRAEGLNLEMKNNFAVQIGTSFFLPPKMKRASQ